MNDDIHDYEVKATTKSRLPVFGEIRHPAIRWPLVLGGGFLVAGLLFEYILQLSGVPLGDESGVPTAESMVSLILRWHSLLILIRELGFAFIIGWIVSYFIDAAAKREQNENFRLQMDELGRQTFRGVFGIKHRTAYVRSVIEKCLEARLIREDYVVSYTLDAFTPAEARKSGIEHGRFVKVSAEIRYRARNVGGGREKFTTSYGIPLRSGNLEKLSFLNKLKIGQAGEFDAQSVKQFLVSDVGHGHGNPDEVCYRFDFELDSDESIEVALEAQFVKELSDSETFGFGHPTMDATFALTMNVKNMVLGASPRIIGHLDTVRSPDDGRKGEWKVAHPVLPYNSVILWWRTKADDGSADISADGTDPAILIGRKAVASALVRRRAKMP